MGRRIVPAMDFFYDIVVYRGIEPKGVHANETKRPADGARGVVTDGGSILWRGGDADARANDYDLGRSGGGHHHRHLTVRAVGLGAASQYCAGQSVAGHVPVGWHEPEPGGGQGARLLSRDAVVRLLRS